MIAPESTLISVLSKSAERYPDNIAVSDSGRTLSYQALSTKIATFSRNLRDRGLAPGSRVLIVLQNRVEFLVAHFGILHANLVSVPLDAAIGSESLSMLASKVAAQALVCSQASWEEHQRAAGINGIIPILVGEGLSVESTGGALLFNDLCDSTFDREIDPYQNQSSPDQLATIMFTTGSTGEAKGVMLTHRNILSAVRNIIEFVRYTSKDREIVTLPLSHNFGLAQCYCNLFSGGAVFLESGLSRVGRILKTIDSFSATGFPTTPRGIALLLDQYGPVFLERAKALRFMVINSAPLPPARMVQLREALPGTEIFVYYGLTEASRSTFISLSREPETRYRSVGKAMNGVQIKIIDNDGAIVPQGTEGEVLIAGPTVTQGYWGESGPSAANIRQGWLHSGDLGFFDSDGYLFISGRLKDIINSGGYKVNPSEIERILMQHPSIVDAGVCGINDAGDEVVAAGLVLNTEAPTTVENILDFLSPKIERFKQPAHIFILESIPRADTGKIKRQELSRLLQLELEKHA